VLCVKVSKVYSTRLLAEALIALGKKMYVFNWLLTFRERMRGSALRRLIARLPSFGSERRRRAVSCELSRETGKKSIAGVTGSDVDRIPESLALRKTQAGGIRHGAEYRG